MSTTTTDLSVSADLVFAVLTDPTTYPYWLVGAKATLSVDDEWPTAGAKFRHVVGMGPLRISDITQSLGIDTDQRTIDLKVNVRPFGKGRVRFHVEQREFAQRSTVIFTEEPSSPLLRLARPIVERMTTARNRRSLDALKTFVQASAHTTPSAATAHPLQPLPPFAEHNR